MKRSLDWYLLEDESHKELKDFTSACLKLNKITDVYMKLIIIQKALDGLMPMTRTTVYSHL